MINYNYKLWLVWIAMCFDVCVLVLQVSPWNNLIYSSHRAWEQRKQSPSLTLKPHLYLQLKALFLRGFCNTYSIVRIYFGLLLIWVFPATSAFPYGLSGSRSAVNKRPAVSQAASSQRRPDQTGASSLAQPDFLMHILRGGFQLAQSNMSCVWYGPLCGDMCTAAWLSAA